MAATTFVKPLRKGHRDRFSWPTDIEREPRYTAGVVPAQFFIHSDIPEKEVEKAPYHLSFVEASTMTRSSLNLRPAAIISYDKIKDKERGERVTLGHSSYQYS